MVSKNKNQLLVWGRDKKNDPRDHRFSSLGKPRDAKRWSSGRICLSYLYTHNVVLYYLYGKFVLKNDIYLKLSIIKT